MFVSVSKDKYKPSWTLNGWVITQTVNSMLEKESEQVETSASKTFVYSLVFFKCSLLHKWVGALWGTVADYLITTEAFDATEIIIIIPVTAKYVFATNGVPNICQGCTYRVWINVPLMWPE